MAKKILIVEDEKPMAKALELKLKHVGFDAVTANNGEDGLKMIEEGGYDLVLLDLVMPKMDGFTVLNSLKSKGIEVPVIILSNLSQKEDEKKTKDLGAKGFFIKSNASIADIVDHVSTLLA